MKKVLSQILIWSTIIIVAGATFYTVYPKYHQVSYSNGFGVFNKITGRYSVYNTDKSFTNTYKIDKSGKLCIDVFATDFKEKPKLRRVVLGPVEPNAIY